MTRRDETDDARERLASPVAPPHKTAPRPDDGKPRTRARHCRAVLSFHIHAGRSGPTEFFEFIAIFFAVLLLLFFFVNSDAALWPAYVRLSRSLCKCATAFRCRELVAREIPASGERRNPYPQQQQERPHLRADVRTRDVACAMTRSVAAARGACALIRQTDVTRPARQDAQREGSGGTARNTACVCACVRA